MAFEDQFHSATRAMLATTRALARGEAPPRPAGAEKGLADRLFALERSAGGEATVRAFGDALTPLFGRDLRGEDFSALFFAPDRALFHGFMDAIEAARDPAVMRCDAETVGHGRIALEILLAPLDPAHAGPRRQVGLIQPLGELDAADAIVWLRLKGLYPPAARAPLKGLRLVVDNR